MSGADIQLHFVDRKDGAERLVVAMREFKGRKYVDVRVYVRTSAGNYVPTKTGVTIGLSEVFNVHDAFGRACDLAMTVKP